MADVKYTPRNDGVAKLARGAAVQDVSLRAAQRIANTARSIAPKTEYTVSPAQVTAGWNNETRAGAIVSDTRKSLQGGRKQSLKKAIQRNQT